MQDILKEQSYAEGFASILSPLNPCLKLNQLLYVCVCVCKYICMYTIIFLRRPEKCKFMDSKMKPLWLVFENADKDGKDVYQIFKHGDGNSHNHYSLYK